MNLTKKKSTAKEEKIVAGLNFISSVLSEWNNEIDFTKKISDTGYKTSLWKEIEKKIENPLNALFEVQENVNELVVKTIDKIVYHFLVSNKNLIDSAYKVDIDNTEIVYFIILKNDTLENRLIFYRFLSNYDALLPISKYVKLNFLFSDKKNIDGINISEQYERINLDE